MESRSEGRVVSLGLLAAASGFGGMVAALYGSAVFLSGGYAAALLPAAAWLVFAFSVAPALAVYVVIRVVARILEGGERGSLAAASAFLGGALGLCGSWLVNGLFLFVGWFLFPWTFAYAGTVLPSLLRQRPAGAGGVALHVGVATAVFAPWIALTLYNAVDTAAELAGAREGAGWIENFPSAIVLSILYGIVVIAAMGAIPSRSRGQRPGQPASSDRTPTQ